MKYGKREMRRNYNRKGLTALVAAVLLFCCTVGGTLAWLATSTGDVVNTFTPANITTEVEEKLEGGTKKDVYVQNGSTSIDAYIRAVIVVNWVENATGNIYGKAPKAETDYTLTLGSKWLEKTADGQTYYYYPDVVKAGGQTTDLIESIAPVVDNAPAGCHLEVTILTEAIQADGKNSDGTPAVELAWTDVEVNTDGTLRVKQ